jgi:class 3 adenylate cyclase
LSDGRGAAAQGERDCHRKARLVDLGHGLGKLVVGQLLSDGSADVDQEGTFLFTDIEGSTRRWESDPEGMRGALAGWLFKHTGDGVCAAFASPRAAVDAAIAAQRSLALPVRMGIATQSPTAEPRARGYAPFTSSDRGRSGTSNQPCAKQPSVVERSCLSAGRT